MGKWSRKGRAEAEKRPYGTVNKRAGWVGGWGREGPAPGPTPLISPGPGRKGRGAFFSGYLFIRGSPGARGERGWVS